MSPSEPTPTAPNDAATTGRASDEPILVVFGRTPAIERLTRPIDDGREIDVKGGPQSNVARFVQHPSGHLNAGTWDCGPGSWEGPPSEVDEVFTIIEGAVSVGCVASGTRHDLKAGDTLYLPRGARTLWTIDHYVKKAFVILPSLPSS